MRVIAAIPARWGSTRFPGKPLTPILGKAMIRWCWEAASAADGIDDVVVATDDARIAEAVHGFGGRAVMTRDDHASGTDRLAEVAVHEAADVIVNLQGDEPLLRPGDVARLAALLRSNATIAVATLCHRIDASEAANPNRVKVVCDAHGDALYFSRFPIPYDRGGGARYLQHAGIYAYRSEVLAAFPALPRPAEERAEELEQLRLLAAGIKIRVIEVEPTGPGVDAPEDVAVVARLLADRKR